MSLGVIPMIWFEFFRILVKNHKKERTRKTRHHGPLRRGEGCLVMVRPWAKKRLPHGFAAA